ncbi:MAG: RnfABCDGE type electron transport complex subunit D [Candidatus Izimaplasma sp.]|nr:RnfABCDGE type electron transport complex subunit D [Candidatus Izimaplasma bacterium]
MEKLVNDYGSKLLDKKDYFIYTGLLFVLLLMASMVYGSRVFLIALVVYTISFIVEYTFSRIRDKEFGVRFILTPMLLTLLLPPTIPLWIAGVGAFFSSFFGKALFGGDKGYIFSPAAVGIIFITISFPAFLNTMWLDPISGDVTTSMPIIELARGGNLSFEALLFGKTAGPLGVTYRSLIIIIGIMLGLFKIIDLKITASYLAFFFIFTVIINFLAPETARDPFMSLFVGSLLFGAFFLATDPLISPISTKGMILYGLGLGFITVIIRHFAAFPEGVVFAVVIMNAVSPLIDNLFEKEVVAND